MTKSEVLKIKRKYNLHYPPDKLFDIWEDNEDIPNDILEFLFYKEEQEERPYIMCCGEKMYNKIQESLKNYINANK